MSESVEHCSSSVTIEDNNVRIFKTPPQPLLPKIYYNSGGDKEYMPSCSLENKPFVGMIFDTLQDGIAFYYKYANECGFKVRSSTNKSQKNKDDPTGKGVNCMGREPSCIITDQDPTMGIAIEKLSAIVLDREIDPHVFVDGRNSVMEEFDLVDHEWFAYMFKIKHLWIPAYFRDLFIGGLLRSTSRSEGANGFFCNFTKPHVTCVEFFVRYETVLDAQRHEQDELIRLNKLDSQLVTHLHLEKHAAVVFTRAIFYDFQEECEGACFSCSAESYSSLFRDGVEFSIIIDHEKRKNFDKRCSEKSLDSIINVALDDASKYDKKKQLVSDVCSKIFSCVSLTDQYKDDLYELIRTLSSFEEQMISKNNPENGPSSKEVKDADIQVLVGLNEVNVNILPPNQCLNKGSARSSKKLKSVKEIAIEQKSKKGRTCRACGQSSVSHDSRNCPTE
ncbi:uncharacterized protein LOC110733999 [Chenopodium quinoa]|uniref:uncharacterized protein LOC110733999 n=1 Tax=Chenopodium quinoa TaxID=63459 RepID=UPI000B775542|nr:uncharacterized protein LOC110733999 [Chenopodium quinoa]